jgi:hypothetical protein
MVATILQIVGVTVIAVGAGLIYPPLGVVLAGVGLTIFGLAMERSK